MNDCQCRTLHAVPSDRASELIAERGADYGPPEDNMRRTAQIWSGILDVPVTARQVALCMVGVKLARDAYRQGADNFDDGDTYWRIANQRV